MMETIIPCRMAVFLSFGLLGIGFEIFGLLRASEISMEVCCIGGSMSPILTVGLYLATGMPA